MYYIVFPDLETRTRAIVHLKEAGIHAVFHYVPLHDSPYGKDHGRVHGDLNITRITADRLLRLPLWLGVEPHQQRAVDALFNCLTKSR